jgi:metallo-beta-lactamase family protein
MLIDCGMAQGHDTVTPMQSWSVSPTDIHYLSLTHAHIDHIGRIPELIAHGFKGEILCTHPTKALLLPLLKDALSFTDFDRRQKQNLLERIDELSYSFEFGEDFTLKKGIHFKFQKAGHILGSAFIRFDLSDNYSIVFSGDLGSTNTPILCDPDTSDPCDHLLLESTYGNRLHGDRTHRTERLGHILTRCLADSGKVFIPAFALGRTQEFIYEMDRLNIAENLNVPVYIDSPLGLEITRSYHTLAPFWDHEAKSLYASGDHPLNFKNLHAVRDHAHHLDLVHESGPMIVLAGSGMCSGGRIVDHLRYGLGDSRNDILFVGHQSGGTLGSDLLRYGDRPGGYVYIDGEQMEIRAKVHRLTGYSAHADQQGWLIGFGVWGMCRRKFGWCMEKRTGSGGSGKLWRNNFPSELCQRTCLANEILKLRCSRYNGTFDRTFEKHESENNERITPGKPNLTLVK